MTLQYTISRSLHEDLKTLGLLDDPESVFSKYTYNIEADYSDDLTDPDLLKLIREYYDEHLPLDVTKWVRANIPSPIMIYKNAFSHQVVFVRDVLTDIFFESYDESENNPVVVISHHFSKSIKLPVYQIDVPKLGLKIILRNNFYDWKVSIISSIPIDFEFGGLFRRNEKVQFCEGFPPEYVFTCFNKNNQKFTVDISNDYKLYTFLYILKNQLLRKKGSF